LSALWHRADKKCTGIDKIAQIAKIFKQGSEKLHRTAKNPTGPEKNAQDKLKPYREALKGYRERQSLLISSFTS